MRRCTFAFAAVVTVALTAGCGSSQPAPAATQPAPAPGPPKMPDVGLYVTNETSGDLTERERQVVALIARGQSNGEIASELVVSKRIVEKHIANILSKLALTSRAQIVRWAIDHGLTQASAS